MKGIYLAAAVMLLSTSAYAVTESKNGTVTDGWLTVEDFQSKKAGEKMEAWNVENNPIQATVSIVEDAKDANNLAVKCEKGNHGDLVVIPVTLANGKKLSDYKTIQFDIYRYGDDSNYKKLFIYVDDEKVFASEKEVNWSEVGDWTTYSFSIPDGLKCADKTTVNLQIGIRDGAYALDNVKLEEKGDGSATASTNGTVTDGWLMAEDFQNKNAGDSMTAWNWQSYPTEAAVSIVKDVKDANNLAVKCENGNDGDLVVIPVTLGKKLSDYKTIQFDIYRYGDDSNDKKLFIYVDNEKVFASENDANWSTVGDWTTYSFSIPDGLGCADKTTVNLQIGIMHGAYALDNVKLEEKGDGSATASTNGTVTDGWLMAEDFQNKTVGDVMNTWDYFSHDKGSGTCTIDAEPNKAENMMAKFEGGNWNTLIEVPVTLPEGKTIANYETIKFDIYRFSGDDNHKQIAVYIGNDKVEIDENYIERAPVNGWKTWEYSIPASVTPENQILIRLGIKSNQAKYAIDNIQLKERADLPPVEYDATTNGTVTEKKLMVNDFQHHGAAGVVLGSWARVGSVLGNVATAEDPEKRSNLVGSFSGTSNYNTVMEIPVTLPEGKTLKDYNQISFKLYRYSDDANHKKMRVQADDYEIHYDYDYADGTLNYPEQAPSEVWTEKTYPIEQNVVGNTFKLRLGIESDKPHYLIDNVMLQERDVQSGINRVSDAGMSVAVDGNSLIIMAAPEMEVNVYSIDGQLSGTMTGEGSIELKHGVYIVTAAGKSVKIIL